MLLPVEKDKPFRIALLGIYHESNTFIDANTTIGHFQSGRWLKGNAMLQEYRHAYHELGGAIEVFEQHHAELLPVFYTESTPGGIITEDAYEQIVKAMLQELEKALPFDACFVVPHGAAVAVNHPDMDGDWLNLVRDRIGAHIPIIGTLDPHANVSHRMVQATQALFPYRTNPHLDQRETGRRAAGFLLETLRGNIKPRQLLWQMPMAIRIDKQETAASPCRELYALASSLTQPNQHLYVEIALGFPYADVVEMGSAALIISNNDAEHIAQIQSTLENYICDHFEGFAGGLQDADETLQSIYSMPKPVLVLDMGDNVGGGSMGDSTILLKKLDNNKLPCFISIFDPAAVAVCLQHARGAHFELSLGKPHYQTNVRLISTHEGKFTETRPRHGGQLNYDMGLSAIVVTANGTTLLLHSKRIPPFSLAQLTSCHIDPAAFAVLIAKGVNAPIAAYAEVCQSILRVHTPGSTQADMTQFVYHHRRKPLYPFEPIALCQEI